MIPDFITHYYLGDRKPFLNLSDLPDGEVATVIAEMERRRQQAGLKRVFGQRYMALRRLTEARMRELFTRAGGRLERRAPHYFVVGTSEWFLGLAPDMRALALPLTTLPSELASFTYPDSVTAMGCGAEVGLPVSALPYHDHVYRLEQLSDIVSRYGIPDQAADASYDGYATRPFERYIEVQLWSDEPVRSWIDEPTG